MRVAVLDDIHGNLPALEAVLDELRGLDLDRIVVGGDVFPGPLPHLVLERLLAFDIPVDFIYGNGEVALLECIEGRIPGRVPESYRASLEWNAYALDTAAKRAVAAWPMTRRLTMPEHGDVLFCHATPRDENEIFTALTPEEKLLPIFDAAGAAVVVCGHTHMPFDRTIGRTRVVNAGSVGMPFGPAGADWLLLGSDIEARHTPYDLQAAADRIRRSGYPAAGEFVSKYVLTQPSGEEMLALYSKHELTA